jgi:hypothetical protein
MGYIIEHNDKAIWQPSRAVGQVFLSQLQYLEGVVGVSAGLHEYMSDTINVEFNDLWQFLQAVSRWVNFDNRSMCVLVKGVVVHVLAIASCMEPPKVAETSQFPSDWIEEAVALGTGAMERVVP